MNNNVKMCKDADKVLEAFIEELPMETSHNRMESQKTKCGFGLQGVCCRLCSNGPCRVTSKSPRGVCGADSDTIVVRNFLRNVAAGSGCYTHVVENAAKELKKVAQTGTPLKGRDALYRLSGILNIKGNNDSEIAINIADAVLSDLYKPVDEKMQLVEAIGYKPRIDLWKKTNLMPGGGKDEIFNSIIKTSTNLSSDPMDMLVQCLRLGVSTGLYGLVLSNLLNDIIMGEGEITLQPVGLGVLDPDCINIMITGHQHGLFGNLEDYIVSDIAVKKAREAGAKGFKIVGATCVGQDFQQRYREDACSFCGYAGNNYTSEAMLATGCIDLVVSEFNCTLPGIEDICDSMNIPQLCIDDVAKKKNADYMPYTHESRIQVSEEIVNRALESFKSKHSVGVSAGGENSGEAILKLINNFMQKDSGQVTTGELSKALSDIVKQSNFNSTASSSRKNPMSHHGHPDALCGITEVTLKKFLGGSYTPLIDLIKQGKIKGIAAIVGCSNLRAKGHDVFTVELAKELIKKDIIVLSAGCTSGALGNCGLLSPKAAELAGANLKEVCTGLGIPPVLNFGPCLAIGRIDMVACEIAEELGVDTSQLPVVISAPQWLEEQSLADGAFALTMGFNVHLGLPPFITGSKVALKVLTEDMEQITGGKIIVDTDINSTANALKNIIMQKRRELGL